MPPPKSSAYPRHRWQYAVAALLVLICGLLTRPLRHALPAAVTDVLGDALWSWLVYLLLCLLRPSWPAPRVFAAALVFSFAIETSQRYHAPWIDAVRRTTLGGLILGWGFNWGDFVSYTAGCLGGWGVDWLLGRRRRV